MQDRVQKKKGFSLTDIVATGSFDVIFVCLVAVLVTVGIVVMFSASYVSASYDADARYDSMFYFKRQAVFAVVGLAAMFFISRIKYTLFKKLAYVAFGFSVLLLVLVLIFPAEIPGKEDVKRWLNIPGFRSFQPSEVAKFALVLFCACDMEKRRKKIDTDWKMMFPYMLVIGGVTALVFLEDHLSGTILILCIGVAMTYLGGIHKGWFVAGIALAALGVAFFVLNTQAVIDFVQNNVGDRAAARIISWLDKDSYALSLRWQTNQSLYAIGSGGLFGLGLGNSKQKHLYVSEPQNDFVFSIGCEELGFIGAVVIIMLFSLLIWRGFVIAMKAKDRFGALLVMGIMVQVGLQTILNILVVTDTIPNTGISLPFFSYGGTSLLMLLGEMGVVLSVSRSSRVTKK